MACAFRMTQKKYADLEKVGSALCEFCKAVRQENCNSCTLHEVLDSAWMEAAAEGVIDNWRITRKQDLSNVLKNADVYVLVDGMNDKSAEEKVALEMKI